MPFTKAKLSPTPSVSPGTSHTKSKIMRAFSFRQKKDDKEVLNPKLNSSNSLRKQRDKYQLSPQSSMSIGSNTPTFEDVTDGYSTTHSNSSQNTVRPPLPPKSNSKQQQNSSQVQPASDKTTFLHLDRKGRQQSDNSANNSSSGNNDPSPVDGGDCDNESSSRGRNNSATHHARSPSSPIQTSVSSVLNRVIGKAHPNSQEAAHFKKTGKSSKSIEVKYVRIHGPSDGAYKNESEPRGYIFIKNFDEFDDEIYPFRSGSSRDYYNQLELFQQMGYKKSPKYCESGNITKEKFMRDLKAFSKEEHKLVDSTVIIIMSHGIRDKTFVTSDNEEVELMDVYSMFNNTNCKGLRNKPKIFILQFCRPKSDPRMSFSKMCPSPSWQASTDEVIEQKVRIQVSCQMAKLESQNKEFQEKIIASLEAAGITMLHTTTQTSTTPVNGSSSSSLQAAEASAESEVKSPLSQLGSPPFRMTLTDDDNDYGSCSSSKSTTFCFPNPNLLSHDARRLSSVSMEPNPDYSDMYSIFATNSGGMAYRDPKKGSLFIQAICHVFSNHAYQDDIEELVRKVSKHMQQQLSKDNPVSSSQQAVVERVNNGLDKAFYFNPFPVKEKRRNNTLKW